MRTDQVLCLGVTAWSSTPLGPIKDHLLQLCNQELLRRPYFPPPLPPRPAFALDPHSTSTTTGGAGRETGTMPLLPDPQAPPPAPGEMPVLFPNGDSSAAPNGIIMGMGGEDNKSEQERVRREWDEKEREWQREKDEVIKKRKRDRPLDRGYTFLRASLFSCSVLPHECARAGNVAVVSVLILVDRRAGNAQNDSRSRTNSKRSIPRRLDSPRRAGAVVSKSNGERASQRRRGRGTQRSKGRMRSGFTTGGASFASRTILPGFRPIGISSSIWRKASRR